MREVSSVSATQLVDIGVNLTNRAFARDPDAVIEGAMAAGVTRMIVTGTSVAHSEAALELCARWPGVLWATAGIHPHHASECDAAALRALEGLLAESAVVAVGECGLDFNRNYSPPEQQEAAFVAQLGLARDCGKPLFLHERDAHARQLELLDAEAAGLPGVAHCFTGDVAQMRAYVARGLHVGVTGWVCDERRGQALQAAVPEIPEDRLLLETDAPWLVPRDLRPRPAGGRNEPRFLPHVCAAVARLRGAAPEAIAAVTTANAERLFGLDRIPGAP